MFSLFQDKELCLSISFSLQYLHLAAILWLSSLCVESQVVKRETAPQPHKMCFKFLFSCFVCWGLPALAVSAAYAVTDTDHLSHMYKVNCWFSENKIYLLTYSFPALSLLSGSACALIRSRVSLEYRLRMEADIKSRTRMSTSGRLELSLYARFVALLTILDICGALHMATNAYFFWVAYNVLHAIQGVLMALSATCNSQVCIDTNLTNYVFICVHWVYIHLNRTSRIA
ncbi:unnamed protein product [Nezara viridula]|uniref:G-protein coupled receptors family 2 profile 2 domain-containing protein n=1 Tax=Nezara viridula TaxID=85310 RepID=A0A9P0H4K6_NEZVI|nr:unnamed protein product [Nezara viridula]